MAYIGKEPVVGNFQKCDAITVVNGQAAYTLNVGGAAVSPENVNHMLVSLNGVLQAPGDSYTISGSTMTFASNLSTGDVIDFVIILGNVLDLGAPSDNTVATASIQANAVTAAKFNADVISGQTELAATPADTDELLISDAGVIKRIDYSYLKSSPSHTLLSTTTASDVANLDITSNINSTYKRYMIDLINVHPATNDTEFRMRFFKSGSIEDASIYDYAFHRTGANGTDTFTNSANAAQIQLNAATSYSDFTGASSGTTKATMNGRILLFDPSNTGVETYCQYDITYHIDGDNLAHIQGAARVEDNGAIDGLRFYFSSGNVEEGIFKLYGIT